MRRLLFWRMLENDKVEVWWKLFHKIHVVRKHLQQFECLQATHTKTTTLQHLHPHKHQGNTGKKKWRGITLPVIITPPLLADTTYFHDSEAHFSEDDPQFAVSWDFPVEISGLPFTIAAVCDKTVLSLGLQHEPLFYIYIYISTHHAQAAKQHFHLSLLCL